MYLKCPNCGFSFGLFSDYKGLSEEEILDLKTCPCGTLMVETEFLEANVLEE